MLVQDFLELNAKVRTAKTALICGSKRFTFGELDAMANRLANALIAQGVKRGDRVAIYLNNSLETVTGILGILKADAAFVSLNRAHRPDKLVSILNNCQAVVMLADVRAMGQGVGDKLFKEVPSLRHIIVCGDRAAQWVNGHGRVLDFNEIQGGGSGGLNRKDKVEEEEEDPPSHEASARQGPPSHLQGQPSPEASAWHEKDKSAERPARKNIELDLACLIYTSGTTGESKGVMSDHSNIVFVTQSIVEYLKNNEQDVILSVLPLAFSYGLYQLMACLASGATLVLEESFAFPDVVLEKMAAEKVTGFAGVPTIYSMLLGMDLAKYDLSSLRYLTNAAAGLPLEHVKRLRQTFPKTELYLMHGLTEVARTMYLPPDQVEKRPASSGIAIPGTELWIEDENGQRLGPGEVGELVVRGRNVMRGYWNAPDLSAQRFRPGPLAGERICYSGDLFKTDEEGYFYFVSRKDDIIKSRGEKVAPREVENVLYTIPGVQDAAVIGMPDATMGQAIKAFIVAPSGNLTEAAVISHCKARLEEYMVPRQVEFRTELPKTGSGKVRRIDLK
jgi:long-chain acyl-CoA synthetase